MDSDFWNYSTDSTKMNSPVHNILHMYWTNFRQLNAYVQENIFEARLKIKPQKVFLYKYKFKKWIGIELNDSNNLQMYIPPGFAHGFLTLSDIAHFGIQSILSEVCFPRLVKSKFLFLVLIYLHLLKFLYRIIENLAT